MSEEIRPFEEYKEMIKDMGKEEMIRGLYDLSARVTKQENIIKEVREYLPKLRTSSSYELDEKVDTVLVILDKERELN